MHITLQNDNKNLLKTYKIETQFTKLQTFCRKLQFIAFYLFCIFNKLKMLFDTKTRVLELLTVGSEQLLSLSSNYITSMAAEEEEDQYENYQNDNGWIRKLTIRTVFSNLYLVLLSLRYIVSGVILNFHLDHFLSIYYSVDLLKDLYRQLGILDRYLALVMWLVPVFMLYIDYLVGFTRGKRLYLLALDLLVYNREDFYRLNPQITGRNLFQLLTRRYDRAEGVRWRWRTLPHFGTPLDALVRLQALALATAIDLALGTIVLVLGLFGCPLAVYLFSLTGPWTGYSSAQKLVIFLDGCASLYLIWRAIKLGLFFAAIINLVLGAGGLSGQQRVMDRKLFGLLKNCNSSTSQRRKTSWDFHQHYHYHHYRHYHLHLLSSFLPTYLSGHFRLITDCLVIDRELISRLFLLVFACMTGLNVYSITMVTLKRELNLLGRAIMVAAAVVQFAVILLALKPLLLAHRTVHDRPSKLLYSSILALSGGNGNSGSSYLTFSSSPYQLHLKLKLSTYCQLLTNSETTKIAFSVGPVGKVTSNAVFQVE